MFKRLVDKSKRALRKITQKKDGPLGKRVLEREIPQPGINENQAESTLLNAVMDDLKEHYGIDISLDVYRKEWDDLMKKEIQGSALSEDLSKELLDKCNINVISELERMETEKKVDDFLRNEKANEEIAKMRTRLRNDATREMSGIIEKDSINKDGDFSALLKTMQGSYAKIDPLCDLNAEIIEAMIECAREMPADNSRIEFAKAAIRVLKNVSDRSVRELCALCPGPQSAERSEMLGLIAKVTPSESTMKKCIKVAKEIKSREQMQHVLESAAENTTISSSMVRELFSASGNEQGRVKILASVCNNKNVENFSTAFDCAKKLTDGDARGQVFDALSKSPLLPKSLIKEISEVARDDAERANLLVNIVNSTSEKNTEGKVRLALECAKNIQEPNQRKRPFMGAAQYKALTSAEFTDIMAQVTECGSEKDAWDTFARILVNEASGDKEYQEVCSKVGSIQNPKQRAETINNISITSNRKELSEGRFSSVMGVAESIAKDESLEAEDKLGSITEFYKNVGGGKKIKPSQNDQIIDKYMNMRKTYYEDYKNSGDDTLEEYMNDISIFLKDALHFKNTTMDNWEHIKKIAEKELKETSIAPVKDEQRENGIFLQRIQQQLQASEPTLQGQNQNQQVSGRSTNIAPDTAVAKEPARIVNSQGEDLLREVTLDKKEENGSYRVSNKSGAYVGYASQEHDLRIHCNNKWMTAEELTKIKKKTYWGKVSHELQRVRFHISQEKNSSRV